jgi:peptidoglycan/LPS O-acetylase OafA/YrhL
MGTIRLLLALAVLLVMHSTPIFGIKMIGAAGAVQGFYVISGFYMALVLNEKYPSGAAGYREFIWQRLLRLLPAYWFCLLMAIVLQAVGMATILPKAGGTPTYQFWREHAGQLPLTQLAFLVFNQLFLLGQDVMLFFGMNPTRGLYFISNYYTAPIPAYQFLFIGPAWSLGLELAFYIIAPFIVRRRWWVLAAIVVLCSVLRIATAKWLVRIGDAPTLISALGKDPWCYRFFPVELGTFLLGSLGYYFYAYARQKKLNLKPLGWIAWPFMVVTVFAIAYPSRLAGVRPVLFFALMATCVPFVFALTKNWAVDRWIGELSYPIYIVHVVVGAVLARMLSVPVGAGPEHLEDIQGWQLLLATIPIAIAIRLLIEQPIDRLRQRMHEKRVHRTEQPEVISPAPM